MAYKADDQKGGKWQGGLKRKKPMKRTGFKKGKPGPRERKAIFCHKAKTAPKQRKEIKKISRSRRRQQQQYTTVRREFLDGAFNGKCLLCAGRKYGIDLESARELAITGKLPEEVYRATEVHHRNGRIGRLLCHTPLFIPSCYDCREWPHVNIADARALGYAGGPGAWNVFPEAE